MAEARRSNQSNNSGGRESTTTRHPEDNIAPSIHAQENLELQVGKIRGANVVDKQSIHDVYYSAGQLRKASGPSKIHKNNRVNRSSRVSPPFALCGEVICGIVDAVMVGSVQPPELRGCEGCKRGDLLVMSQMSEVATWGQLDLHGNLPCRSRTGRSVIIPFILCCALHIILHFSS